MQSSANKGLTAMELLVSMAVTTILLATAVPSFRNYSWNLKMRTAMDQLQTDLRFARSHSISHNVQTVICPTTSGLSCSDEANWDTGWIVFIDLDGDRNKQPAEALIRQANTIGNLKITSSRSRTYLRFLPNGTAPGSNISIQFCDQRGADNSGIISVSNTGRIRQQAKSGNPTENCP